MADLVEGPPEATTCCIAGCGPAGAVLGLLLARAGVKVLVLEKHADFLRDFRGDTIHPSTLVVLSELGLLDEFLQLPHSKVRQFSFISADGTVPLADFDELRGMPEQFRYIAFVPQWDFLEFLVDRVRGLPGFTLRMRAEVLGVLWERGRVVGVRYREADGAVREVRAALTVAADGRASAVRASAQLPVKDYGAPMDVLWFRLPKGPKHPSGAAARVAAGKLLALLDRGDYWQCGYLIRKGTSDAVRERGVAELRASVTQLAPFLADTVDKLSGWEDVRLLTVRVDRLRRWYRPGLLCIGDAAHAMSPVGGVGINLAVQDAVAAANLLARPLRTGAVATSALARVQLRRWLPTAGTQLLQRMLQHGVLAPTLAGRPTAVLTRVLRIPMLRRLPGRFIGIGLLPEHVRSPASVPLRSRGC